MSYSFLNMLKAVMPPWLTRTEGIKVIGGIADVIDDHRDRVVAGVKLRFPGLYSLEGLDKIGRERKLRQGPSESNAVFAERLQRWWIDHRTRGSAYTLLEQMLSYLSGTQDPPFDVVSYRGLRHVMDTDEDVTRDTITWGTDGSGLWAQAWVFIYYSASSISDTALENFAVIVRDWLPAHVLGHLVVIHPNSRLWDYPQPVPDWDGSWSWKTGPTVEDL